MSWLRVDDGFARHPKVLRIPKARRKAAIGLWTLAGTWIAQNLTDGQLPAYMVDELDAEPVEVSDLLAAGLWEHDGDDYRMHDYLDYNRSRADVLAEREAAKQRQRRARERSSEKRSGEVQAESQRMSRRDIQRDSHRDVGSDTGVTSADVRAVSRSPRPDPTRPDPSRSVAPSPTLLQLVPGDVTPDGATDQPHRPWDDVFADFWAAYPRKVGKQDARKVWDSQRRRTDPGVMLAGAARYRDDPNREDQFTAHPATWLRRGGWDDEPLPPRGGTREQITRNQAFTDPYADFGMPGSDQ